MSKSAILKSSIAKKWWMALTGLFLCLFLVGHLLGNLQLLIPGIEGKRAFNEYAYFMTHNPFIKVLSYLTYFSILFHAIDGIALTFQNKKARPQNYAYNKPNENSKWYSRSMAILGSIILIFIVTHMANFWGRMHFDTLPLHTEKLYTPIQSGGTIVDTIQVSYMTTAGDYLPVEGHTVKNGTEIHEDVTKREEMINQNLQAYNIPGTYKAEGANPKVAEGYKDLHSLVMAFFGQDKSDVGMEANSLAIVAVITYVVSMLVLGFHLLHGFSSAFQSLGINHKRYNKLIKGFGQAFAILVPLAFAVIPIIIFLTK